MAVNAGAIRETVEIIGVEDVPLTDDPGNTCRVKVQAAGELKKPGLRRSIGYAKADFQYCGALRFEPFPSAYGYDLFSRSN